MPVATHRPARLQIPRPSRRTTTPAPAQASDPTYQEVYEMLSEAADLVARACRQLRYAKYGEAGFALQPVADEIHDHIRRLPSSVTDRPARPLRRRERSES